MCFIQQCVLFNEYNFRQAFGREPITAGERGSAAFSGLQPATHGRIGREEEGGLSAAWLRQPSESTNPGHGETVEGMYSVCPPGIAVKSCDLMFKKCQENNIIENKKVHNKTNTKQNTHVAR
jgi:hypothetical protein